MGGVAEINLQCLLKFERLALILHPCLLYTSDAADEL